MVYAADVLRRVGVERDAAAGHVAAEAAARSWRRWPVHTGSAGRARMVAAADQADAAWGLQCAAWDSAWGLQCAAWDAARPVELLAALGLVSVVEAAAQLDRAPDRDAVVRAYEGAKSHESRASASSGVRRDQAGWVVETRTPEPDAVARAGPRVASG